MNACLLSKRNLASGSLLVAAIAVCSPVAAQSGDPVRVRGTIESINASEMMVQTREGDDVTIMLPTDLGVRAVAAAEASDIEEGDYVGVASLPTPGGGDGALEVLIFPAAMAGSNTGSFPWDLEPNSTMTNATVSNAVENVDGRELTLTYPEGERTVSLPEGIPVVTFVDATAEDLVTGATVFVPSTRAADGTLSTSFVVVGKEGVVPPM